MKKSIFIAAILLSSAANAEPVFTPDFFFKPYVGVDYDFVHADYKDGGNQVLNDSLNGGDIHIGARIHKYLGFEGSYLWTADATKDNVLGTSVNTKVNVQGGAFDAMGYLPIGNSKFELIGTAGVSYLKGDAGLNGAGGHLSLSKWETKGRVGGGAQYWITDNINLRGIVRYQGASFSSTLDDAIIYSAGLNFQF